MQRRLPTLARPLRGTKCAVAVALTLASVLLAAPRPVRACSCLPPSWQRELRPSPDELVPRNARIWVTIDRAPEARAVRVELLDAAGVEVPVDVSEVAFGAPELPSGLRVLTPRALLEPDREYSYEIRDDETARLLTRVTFRTHDGIDEQLPAVPRVDFAEMSRPRPPRLGEPPSCLSGAGLAVGLEGDTWIALRALPASAPGFDPDAPSGVLADWLPERSGAPELFRGAPCAPAWSGEPLTLQFASFDLAGNFSGWSEPERFAASDGANARVEACSVRAPGMRATPGLEPTVLGAFLPLALLGRRAFSRRARTAAR